MAVNEPQVQIEEVVSVMTPAPGITLQRMLQDACLEGYESMEIDEVNNQVIVTWIKRHE